jgi:hypothetical protein
MLGDKAIFSAKNQQIRPVYSLYVALASLLLSLMNVT